MDKSSSPDAPVETQSRFWVGPLVAGCCFALGYGITDRVLTLQTNAEDPVPQAFTPLAFPGDSLKEIRSRFGNDGAALQVDITALEAAEAASRPPKPELKTTIKPEVALQTPQAPVWTAPAWSDPQTITPDLEPDLPPEVPAADGTVPSTDQEEVLDSGLDEGNTDLLVFPEPIDTVPAVLLPADDSPVLMAEPEPVLAAPGSEAFFETIEPVLPPQP
ncbi:hypothetical protein KR52_03515 [Synechococcus sp. KORDI-52]|uniref:hypothetical protein n=1 Tax=Synechococcus sp. KORDI-52 TaxID=585425 RepID=UPI0004E054E0|nr:hypothetical protein [Synechococcus sp. KORDI-52]AII48226.1 hypothetical protein KR52_03515 [Synechococcus sp. KORDI-52]